METCKILELPTDGPLVRYAIDELKRVGLHEADDYGGALARAVVDVMRAFSRAHCGSAAPRRTLELVERLARWKPLGPLTDDPAGGRTSPKYTAASRTGRARATRRASRGRREDLLRPRRAAPGWRVMFGVGRKTRPTVPARVRP
jgi:hypothetical protein